MANIAVCYGFGVSSVQSGALVISPRRVPHIRSARNSFGVMAGWTRLVMDDSVGILGGQHLGEATELSPIVGDGLMDQAAAVWA